MHKFFTFFASILSFISCSDEGPAFELENGLHISNITILTSEDGDYIPYVGHVLTENDKIVYVGKADPSPNGNVYKIDGTGKFLIPGLIDSHVHLGGVLGMVYHQIEQYPDLADEFKMQEPRSFLFFGFTTLINLGGISEEFLDFYHDQPLKPDLFHTGRSGASVANGYPMNFTPEQFRFERTPNFIYHCWPTCRKGCTDYPGITL